MKIRQFRYSADNFAYLLYGERSALVIDGGAVEEILSFIDSRGLVLKYVTNTHGHWDHTCGNRVLIDATKAAFIDNDTLRRNGIVDLDGETISVYHTPGHTEDSVCFHSGDILVTGDTLFNGTVGNCFSGDLEAFYRSIAMLMSLPGSTIVYAGHDYVADSMRFARWLEPGNEAIDVFLKKYDSSCVYSTLPDERAVNPYLRFNDPSIVSVLSQRNLPVGTELDRWHSLMSIG